MNEIKKCSIGGISFTLEQNAYDVLCTYIDSLKAAYKDDPDGEEILADIEARIAELILNTQPADAVIARPLVDNIIKQLGMPNEIDDEKAEHSAPHSPEHTDLNGNPRIPRRLYRDLENSKLGGVCSGIAKYFDIDPTWVRLAMFAPLILSIFGQLNIFDWHFMWKISSLMGNLFSLLIVGYIIMWFVVPAASSARQKLEQQGERVTAQGIKANTQAAYDERERTLMAKIFVTLGGITLALLKVIAAMILIGLVVGFSVLGLVALSALPMMSFDFVTGLALLSFFFVVLIPLAAMIYLAVMFIGSRKPNGRAMLIALILWVVALATMTVSAIKSPVRFENSIENAFDAVFEKDSDLLYKEFSQEEIDEFRRSTAKDADAEGNVTRTHVQGATQIVLSGEAAQVEELETKITFGEKGIEIIDEGKSVLSITKDGITVDNEKVATFQEDANGFTMSVGDVKIKVNDEGGSVVAASNGVKEGHDYRVVDDIAVERHQKSDRVIIFCGEADDVKACKERLNFTNTEITFVADKKYCVRINRSGEVDYGFAKFRNRVSDKIDADTRYGEFFVDNADVLVYYEIGPNADMYRKSAESLCRQFKKLD